MTKKLRRPIKANKRDVIIVGGGPVGCALALDLGLRGVSSVILESRTTLGNIPKGQGLTQRTLEHFYFWGLTQELRAARLMPRGYPIGEITAYRNLASDYWHAPAGREVVNEFFFQKNERLPQYRMEAVLRRRLETQPNVDVRLGVTATDIMQAADDVGATAVKEGGATETFEADYVIGCDGSHSMVRERAGIARSGTNYDQNMVLIVFRSRDLHEKLKRFPERSTYRVLDPDLHGYWKFFGRVDVGEEFFFHVPIPNDVDRSNFNFNECLFHATGFQFDFEIIHAAFWDLRNAVASTYRNGRIFIAGDAAHSHPPYGGYGLNNGLEDAVNLSWKLAASLAGWGGDELLDSYSAEREPIFREIAEDFIAARIREDDTFLTRYTPERDRAEFEAIWKARESDVGSRRKAYEPHYDGSPIVCGPSEGKTAARGRHSLQARAGHHLSPQVLSSGRNVYEELGRDFTLIALGADAAGDVAAFEQAARSRKIPLKIIRDTAMAVRENYRSPLILVRPDQHIAWVGEAAEDAGGIIQKAAGQ